MQPRRILIVGGVAPARARRLSETAEITVIERGPDVSFANCGRRRLFVELFRRSRINTAQP